MNLFTYSHRLSAQLCAGLALVALVLGVLPMQASAQVPNSCSLVIVSGSETLVAGTDNNAQPLSFVHQAWGAISGAAWIWGDNPVADTTSTTTQTFREEFGFVGAVTSAQLEVLSDNSHDASLNNGDSHAYSGNNSYNNLQTYDVAADVAQGDNVFEIEVVNYSTPTDSNPQNNPAGVIYKLTIQGTPTSDPDCLVDYGFDVCENIRGQQLVVPEGMEVDDSGNCEEPQIPVEPAVCEIGQNLLQNASFEEPAIDGSWSISSISSWLITKVSDGTATMGELWRGLIAPSHGLQNVELDANEPTQITQTVNTTVGATYELNFDFAARGTDSADNNVDALVNGTVLMNANTGDTAWTTYSQTFVATSTTTNISLRDMGTPNSTGSLVDNAILCLVSNPPVDNDDDDDVPTYLIYGYIWHDDNRNEAWEGRFEEGGDREEALSGRTVRATNGSTTVETTTDEAGRYELHVPAGTWVVTEELPSGWFQTGAESHTVTVPGEDSEEEEGDDEGPVSMILNFIIPTAHAQLTLPEYNFGNDRRSGGGGGRSLSDDDDDEDRDGEVLGDSDDAEPEPLVLGEQVSAVPLGAADTGAGGTAPVAVELSTLAPVAFIRRK